MNSTDMVVVCSRSFSNNPILRSELLAKYKNVTFNDSGRQFEGEELVAFLSGATKAIVALEKFNSKVISQLSTVRTIAKYGVGLDMIDMEALRAKGIKLGWQSGVNKRSVSELALCFMLSLLRNVVQLDTQVKSGTWKQVIGDTLTGKRVGIVGCGNVGKDLVHLLKPFQCEIFANDIIDYKNFYAENSVRHVSLNDLLSHSEIISIHTPLDASTHHLINNSNINLIADDAILINTARGGIVDEVALEKKLISSQQFKAGFDVLEVEPPNNSRLMTYPNFFCSSHIGGSTKDSILKMGRAAIESLDGHYII